MSSKLSAFEKQVLGVLAEHAGLAATLFDAWAQLPPTSVQTVRSLVDLAQLGVTEEGAAAEVLRAACEVGLVEPAPPGYRPKGISHGRFERLAFALNCVEYYATEIHCDQTQVQVALTKPPRPSMLEQRLAELGWRTADLEPTEHAFHGIIQAAQKRVVVMTPFFDQKGADWLRELLSCTRRGVERILVLRSLEAPMRRDYPRGFDAIEPWLKENAIKVYNYSLNHMSGVGRETFHAKVVSCDRVVSNAFEI